MHRIPLLKTTKVFTTASFRRLVGLEQILADKSKIEAALRAAVRKALALHGRQAIL
jgi:hypothetical protein